MQRKDLENKVVLGEEAFNKMLLLLDTNRDQAALKYELIRQKLIKFFEYQNCAFPEDYTDETINRVTKRIYEGELLRTETPTTYFLGIARNVLREYRKKINNKPEDIENIPISKLPLLNPKKIEENESEREKKENQLECLKSCLELLFQEDKELLAQYYSDDGKAIDNRKIIADNLGISLANLRIRVHRLREKLEQCVNKCLKKM
ncbi:MAG: hypothetical protein FD167_238 [bacterium]|nr:MAG: hypothetical protein FD167_238 [bacterium]